MNEIAIAPLLSADATGSMALPAEVLATNAEFFSALSHELRTPVTAIKAFAQGLVLHWDDLPAEKRYFYVERILKSSLRLEHLVNDLSLAAGLVAGAPLHLEPLDIGTAVAQALDEVRIVHDARTFSVTPDPGPSAIVADPQRVLQVLVSLLDAAAYHAPPQEAVTIRWLSEPPMLRVEVYGRGCWRSPRDNALRAENPGPPASHYRQPSHPLEIELGLSICKKLVEAMGGASGARTISGAGTVFWLTLPQTLG